MIGDGAMAKWPLKQYVCMTVFIMLSWWCNHCSSQGSFGECRTHTILTAMWVGFGLNYRGGTEFQLWQFRMNPTHLH